MTQLVRAVGFLDLAMYTSLTDVHGDEAAADVVDRFCAVVRDALGNDDVLVKSIGDAVLVHSADPDALAALAARVCVRLDAEPAFPVLRVGLHVGPVLLRAGDIFGGTVNIAARVAAQAHGGQVLATAAFADDLVDDRWPRSPLGAVQFKGLPDAVDVVELELCPHPEQRQIDPACGMAVAAGAAAATVRLEGEEIAFCSRDCLVRWAAGLR
ncbi:MAG: adenylate/guanylate cyclase domain-containing protein [Frankiales bacterium]|nr:MAG: adenylate/guanylate cyclase domain-containing protein [Frankiales bacterium]